MLNGQIFVKAIFPTRPKPNYVSFEINNLRSHHAFFKYVIDSSIPNMRLNFSEFTSKFRLFCENNNLLRTIKYKFNSMPKKLKNQSVACVRTWTRQCECVSAQQVRRGQQMFCLYTKLWEERALNEFLKVMRQQILRKGKQFIVGAIGISVFDWETNRIPDDEIIHHINDFAYIEMLKNDELNCKCCQKRKVIDFADPKVAYCKCPGEKDSGNYKDNWEPYLERNNLRVWRRQRPNGCYEYKVYGSYDDVTAMDFLKVQVDMDYRKKWDTTAVRLEVIESEEDTNSDIIYWEMLWPRLFTNRDYVFNRRFLIKDSENLILLYSKGTEHPSCPAKRDKYRILEYYSCMVIRSTSGVDKPGIEFSLTYFDNPGVNLPAAVTSWVAMAAMPDFLDKLRVAAKNYEEYLKQAGRLETPNAEVVPIPQVLETPKVLEMPEILKTPEMTPEVAPQVLQTPEVTLEVSPKVSPEASPEVMPEVTPPMVSNEMAGDSDKSSTWRYLHPHYYFG